MKNCVVLLLAVCAGLIVLAQAKKKCDTLGVNFYDFIGCTEKNTEGDCPSEYDCKYERRPGKCLFNGAVLSDRDPVQHNAGCNFGCFCNAENNTKGNFICAQGQCGAPPRQNCYSEYELDSCCGRERCEPSSVTCEVDGKTYKEGQKFYPKDECTVCICTKDFNGKYEGPHCKRRECPVEVSHTEEIEKNCAPVYGAKAGELLCCPLLFMCPSKDDHIHHIADISAPLSCKYGDKSYRNNTIIIRDLDQYGIKQVACECKLPPLLTCTST